MDRRTDSLGSALVSSASAATALVAALPSAYLLVVTVAGLVPRRRVDDGAEPTTRFAILVPAHDEEAGIAETLASFDSLDYPRHLFSVHVVADNCTDQTADVVRKSPWEVHERSTPNDRGKGPALNWLFDRLIERGDELDAIVVVDADTTMEVGFLRAMDRELRLGAQAAQGYYSVRDPDVSAASSFRFAALACRHHLRPLGRQRLGGSAGLYGNGMAFTKSLFGRHRFTGHLVEDAELQNELLLAGQLVTYVPDAVVSAEMPQSLEQATTQNERWERGRIEMAQRYVPALLAGLGAASGTRIARLDAVCDHLVPPLSVLVTMQLGVAGAHFVAAVAGNRTARRALVVDAAALAMVGGHAVAGLASVRAPAERYRALLAAPKAIAWKVGIWAKTLRSADEVAWTRTERNVEATR